MSYCSGGVYPRLIPPSVTISTLCHPECNEGSVRDSSVVSLPQNDSARSGGVHPRQSVNPKLPNLLGEVWLDKSSNYKEGLLCYFSLPFYPIQLFSIFMGKAFTFLCYFRL